MRCGARSAARTRTRCSPKRSGSSRRCSAPRRRTRSPGVRSRCWRCWPGRASSGGAASAGVRERGSSAAYLFVLPAAIATLGAGDLPDRLLAGALLLPPRTRGRLRLRGARQLRRHPLVARLRASPSRSRSTSRSPSRCCGPLVNLALARRLGHGPGAAAPRAAGSGCAPSFRVLLIVPWAVPNYITALIWKGMFHRQFGAVNAILARCVGLPRVELVLPLLHRASPPTSPPTSGSASPS